MDKLQPIIRNKFWIFAFIAILAPIYPWMTTVNEMKAAYTAGEGSIKQSFSSVPTNPNPENDNWITPVNQATAQQQGRYDETQKMLWDMEKPLFVWPDEIQTEIVNNKIPFWGELPTSTLRKYKNNYLAYKFLLWKNVLHAFTPKAAGPITPAGVSAPQAKPEAEKSKPGEDIVAFPFTDLPLPDLSNSKVDLSSKEVWEAQEDLWLLQSIFKSIAKVNRQQPIPAVSQMNAVIKQIYKLELMGGAKSRLTPGSPGSSVAGPPFTFTESSAGPAATGGINPLGPQLIPQNDIVSFSFIPSEEFGTGMVSRAPTASATVGAIGALPGSGSKPAATPAQPAAGVVGGKVVPDEKRYVDKQTKELNLRTRAFYIELLMDNDKIPQLLTEMRNSPWPTRIYRVQMAAKDNATAPPVNYATPAGAIAAAPREEGAMRGFGRGRRRDEDDDSPVTPQAQKPVAEVGPLASPKLAYVAIAGLITIYLPPTDAEAQATYLPAGSAPATSPQPGEKPVTTAQAPQPSTPPATEKPAAASPENPAGSAAAATETPPTAPAGSGDPAEIGAPVNRQPASTPAEQPPATPPPDNS